MEKFILIPSNVNEMSLREINAYLRKKDESHLWPICGRFNATERAIQRVRRMRRKDRECANGLEYYMNVQCQIIDIVNDAKIIKIKKTHYPPLKNNNPKAKS